MATLAELKQMSLVARQRLEDLSWATREQHRGDLPEEKWPIEVRLAAIHQLVELFAMRGENSCTVFHFSKSYYERAVTVHATLIAGNEKDWFAEKFPMEAAIYKDCVARYGKEAVNIVPEGREMHIVVCWGK